MNQFNDYLTSQNLDPYTMSEDERKALEKNYTQQLYPGSTATPGSMINVLTSENPSETIKAKIVTDPKSVCVDIPSGCEAPWFLPTSGVPGMDDVCVANFGKTTSSNDLCANEGGETMYFDDVYGIEGCKI